MSLATTHRLASVGMGLVSTVIVQSSSIITVMAVGFVSSGLLNLTQAINVIIGSNIGTTATAWLAAFNGSALARQTALAHTLFNVAGTVVIIPFFVPVILPVATSFFPNYAEAAVVNGVTTYPNVAAPMAAIHTLFNLITTALILPFVKPFARLVARIIPADAAEKPHLSALSTTGHISPVIACDQALLEVAFMRDSDLDLMKGVRKVLTGEADQKLEDHIAHRENVLDNVQREVTEFLGRIMVKRVPAEVAERARRLLRLSDELESVSDEAATILKATRRLRKNGQTFSEPSQRVLLDIHDRAMAFAERVSSLLRSPRPAFDLGAVQNESKVFHGLIRTSRQGQLNRIGPNDPASPMRVLAELDILNAYERIRAYYLNCAETLAGGK